MITPSRTMVSAWAAVLRQDGWGTSEASVASSMVLAVAADIVALLNFFFSSQHFHTGNERAVNDLKLAFRDFQMVANWSL